MFVLIYSAFWQLLNSMFFSECTLNFWLYAISFSNKAISKCSKHALLVLVLFSTHILVKLSINHIRIFNRHTRKRKPSHILAEGDWIINGADVRTVNLSSIDDDDHEPSGLLACLLAHRDNIVCTCNWRVLSIGRTNNKLINWKTIKPPLSLITQHHCIHCHCFYYYCIINGWQKRKSNCRFVFISVEALAEFWTIVENFRNHSNRFCFSSKIFAALECTSKTSQALI